MLKINIEWELVNPKGWSDFYEEDPELNEEGFWQEKNLKTELKALHHYTETRGLDFLTALKEIVKDGFLRIEKADSVEVIDFSSFQKIYKTWEYVRQCCENYARFHVCEDESYLGCRELKSRYPPVPYGGRILWGSKEKIEEAIFKCTFVKFGSGTEEVVNQHKCEGFEPRRKLKPFMVIVAGE